MMHVGPYKSWRSIGSQDKVRRVIRDHLIHPDTMLAIHLVLIDEYLNESRCELITQFVDVILSNVVVCRRHLPIQPTFHLILRDRRTFEWDDKQSAFHRGIQADGLEMIIGYDDDLGPYVDISRFLI